MHSHGQVGAQTVYLVVIDGGVEWVAAADMVPSKFPWVHFMHCVAHEGSLIIKDICKIEEIKELTEWLLDDQKWFSTGKVGSLLKSHCIRLYKTTRSFIFPAETRFAGKLLQIKRFLLMKDALQTLVRGEEYQRFEFEDDLFASRIESTALWTLVDDACRQSRGTCSTVVATGRFE